MKRETLFLKIVIILMAIPILALCIFWVPGFANSCFEMYPNISTILYFLFGICYVTAIPYFYALLKTLKLLDFIDKNKAFSTDSIKSLNHIKYSAVSILILYIINLPLIYVLGDISDAPGLIVIGMIITFASLVIAVFATVLQKLLQNALEIKEENDLTV